MLGKRQRGMFRIPRRGIRKRARRTTRRRRRKFGRVVSNPRIGGFMGIELKFYDQLLTSSALTAPTDASL